MASFELATPNYGSFEKGEPVSGFLELKNVGREDVTIPNAGWLNPQFGNVKFWHWIPGASSPEEVKFHPDLDIPIGLDSFVLRPGEGIRQFVSIYGTFGEAYSIITGTSGQHKLQAVVALLDTTVTSPVYSFRVDGEVPGLEVDDIFSDTDLRMMVFDLHHRSGWFSQKLAAKYRTHMSRYPGSPISYYFRLLPGVEFKPLDEVKRDIRQNPYAPIGAKIQANDGNPPEWWR